MCEITYGKTLYSSESLKEIIPEYVKAFKKLLKRDSTIKGVVSTGSSGTIVATFLLMKKYDRELVHIHINKPSANSHQGKTSGTHRSGNFVFVDDFIYKGESLVRCIDLLSEANPDVKIKYALVNFSTVDRKKFSDLEIITTK
jgi:orotate phosphoribosyltransferase